MAKKTFEALMKEYGKTKLSGADLALGRDHPDALSEILAARKDWSKAKTEGERTAAHNRAENIRRAYGNYSGGTNGMGGVYSPTYQKPEKAAESENVMALYEKYNQHYDKKPAWQSAYEKKISNTLAEIAEREPFSYDMDADPLYQQYREQYIREGRRAMEEGAAKSAALTGGYGSTYGTIAAQQQYDNYLAGLNDKVPQLEQYAYEKYLDEGEALYDRLAVYQSEADRQYGQYQDALQQYNNDRAYAFDAMEAAVAQQNYENEAAHSRMTESGKNRRAEAELALEVGDLTALEDMGFDTDYLEWIQALTLAAEAK